jgi:ubiquinone/menaquinone biosynthesis C-methylase UbiE
MQAAEMLDLGGPVDEPTAVSDRPSESGSTEAGLTETGNSEELDTAPALRILDLGCGSAVWSCAMAFRDNRATVLAIDTQPCLAAARSTANSIRLGDRFQTLAGDPESVELPAAAFDLVVIAQRLHAADSSTRDRLLDQACRAVAPGGRIVLIDLFHGPARPRLADTIEALKAHVAAPQGGILAADELRQALHARGLDDVGFSFIAASRLNLGMMVASSSAPKNGG